MENKHPKSKSFCFWGFSMFIAVQNLNIIPILNLNKIFKKVLTFSFIVCTMLYK